jgi:2-polyprenyl-3-methyl-5-hydroxy-6-metoxy-1,4-benzoquinol methylase
MNKLLLFRKTLHFINRLKRSLNLVFGYQSLWLYNNEYNKYWESRSPRRSIALNDFQIYRFNWFIKRASRSFTINDIGCGNGAIIEKILDCKDIHVSKINAVDFSLYALSKINDSRVSKYKIDFSDSKNLLVLPRTDYVLLFEVIEHISDAEDLLINSLMLSKKALFFSIPNTGYFPYRLRLLFGKFPIQWKIKPNEHLRFWTLSDLKWWLSELGFLDRSEISTYKGVPVLNFLFPNLFAAGIIVKIDKK